MPDALRFLILTAAGGVNRHQEDVIDYLREENRVLREQLGPRPLRLTDAQRRRLAVRGQKLGRRILAQVAGIVTPDTILRWDRRLIARKDDGSARRRRGRPISISPREVADLVVRMAVEHPPWGYTRIRGALANLGHDFARNTVKRMLHDHGMRCMTSPSPEPPGHCPMRMSSRSSSPRWKVSRRGRTHWSTRKMAERAGVSASTVGRIWRTFGLQPHVVESFKISDDPLFIEKVRDIVGLYLNPPDHAVVLSFDEKPRTGSRAGPTNAVEGVRTGALGRPGRLRSVHG